MVMSMQVRRGGCRLPLVSRVRMKWRDVEWILVGVPIGAAFTQSLVRIDLDCEIAWAEVFGWWSRGPAKGRASS